MTKKQKKVWITGASSGIGKALAIKFANQGWEIAASARRKNLLKELNHIHHNIHPFPVDVTNSTNVKKVFDEIINKFKTIDICVFSAGINYTQFENNLSEEKIRNSMEVNFFGTLNCIIAVNNFFKKKGEGHISMIASLAGYRGLPSKSGYSASKAALINLAESIYLDFKRYGIKVTVINPGFIKTPMTDKNNFNMPMIKSAEFAAEKIFEGLTGKGSFEIHFPKIFSFMIKFLRILPIGFYFKIIELANKRAKH